MDQDQKTTQNSSSSDSRKNDSLGIPVQKSPWLVYALLQIPIVIIMVGLLYFGYQKFKEGN